MPISLRLLALFAMFCTGILLAGCSASKQHSEPLVLPAETSIISGAITYRERIPLPPGSRALITLSDISRADMAATVLSEQVLDLDGLSVPIPFELVVDSQKLDPVRSYAVRAVIRGADDRLLWTTDTVHLIDPTLSSQSLDELVLVRVRRTSSSSAVSTRRTGLLPAGVGSNLAGESMQ